MNLTGRDRAIFREIAHLMVGGSHGVAPNWGETQQGISYWDEVYRNLLSLAKEQTEEEGPSRVDYVTTCNGRHFCTAPTDESHECQNTTLCVLLDNNDFAIASDALEVDYLLGWEVD